MYATRFPFRIDNKIRDTIAPLKRNTNSAARARARASVPYLLPSPSFHPLAREGLTPPQFYTPGGGSHMPIQIISFHDFSPEKGERRPGLLTSSRKWRDYNSTAVGTRRITSAISKDIFKHFFPPFPAPAPLGSRDATNDDRTIHLLPERFLSRFYCLAFTPSFLRSPEPRAPSTEPSA